MFGGDEEEGRRVRIRHTGIEHDLGAGHVGAGVVGGLRKVGSYCKGKEDHYVMFVYWGISYSARAQDGPQDMERN